MNLDRVVNIEDLRQLARRRVTNFIFDMIEGGVEDESGVARNERQLQRYELLPRVLNDVTVRDQTAKLFDRRFQSPFGISPTGPAPLYRRGADIMLAEAAEETGIPFILSGTSGASLERIKKAAPSMAWYQLYPAKDRAISLDVISRARDAGFEILVVTVDTPITPKRERHLRNGVTLPIKPSLRLYSMLFRQAFVRPRWMAEYVRHGGMPLLENWAKYAPPGANAQEVSEFFRSQFPASQTWQDIENFRKAWPGKLIVKGVLHPADATRLVELGADGITVSNHGGKVLDRAPAPIDALPLIKAAVGDRAAVMMDGGIRRGSDIVVARCMGADFAFTGRATLYGVAAAGKPGAAKAIEILRKEIDLILGTIGCPRFENLTGDYLFLPDRSQ